MLEIFKENDLVGVYGDGCGCDCMCGVCSGCNDLVPEVLPYAVSQNTIYRSAEKEVY